MWAGSGTAVDSSHAHAYCKAGDATACIVILGIYAEARRFMLGLKRTWFSPDCWRTLEIFSK